MIFFENEFSFKIICQKMYLVILSYELVGIQASSLPEIDLQINFHFLPVVSPVTFSVYSLCFKNKQNPRGR